MATVYLHIGTMKTGTSALQSFLDENRSVLEKKGYAFPLFKIGIKSNFNYRNAHFLVEGVDFSKDVVEPNLEIQQKAYDQLEEMAKNYDNIILTDEIIWQRSRRFKDFFPKMVERFKNIGCDVKIIVYLRRQDAMVESLYNQNVKSNIMVSQTFTENLLHLKKTFFLDYYSHLKMIEKAVGQGNIIVRVYEKEQFEGTDHTIYSDFLNAIGLSLTDEYKIERPAQNYGLYGNYIEMKRVINGLPEYRELQDFLSRPIRAASAHQSQGDLHSKQTLFEQDELQKFMADYEESNRKVAQEFLERENGVLFYEPIGNLPTWKLDDSTMYQSILLMMTAAFSAQEKKIQEKEKKIQEQEKRIQNLEARITALEKSSVGYTVRRGCRKIKHVVKPS